MSQSAHAEIKKKHTTNEQADNVQRAIGVMQPSCIVPERQQSPWSKHQGGVVGRSDGLGQDIRRRDCSCTRGGGVSVVSKDNCILACLHVN